MVNCFFVNVISCERDFSRSTKRPEFLTVCAKSISWEVYVCLIFFLHFSEIFFRKIRGITKYFVSAITLYILFLLLITYIRFYFRINLDGTK